MAFNPNAETKVVGRRETEAPVMAAPVEDDARRRLMIQQRKESIVARLERQAQEMEGKKLQIEQRWFDDLRQYYGRYDAATEAKLRDPKNKKSRLFANMTRPKTHAWEARLSDMLFPTEDKNWGIKPTPVPELVDAIDENPKSKDADNAREIMAKAKKRSANMEKEIEDQLGETKYGIRCRDVIHDACKLGTGIMKGPMVSNRMRRRWGQTVDKKGMIDHVMQSEGDPRPEFVRVDPWNYFPDMSARTPEEKEFDYERHLKNKKEMRSLAKQPGFYKDAIRELLIEGPQKGMPNYISQLRDITTQNTSLAEERYIIWEYHGPLEIDEIRDICECMNEEDFFDEEDVDPLMEVNVIAWVCQGRLLKFGPHPLESEDSLYSIFPFEKDDTSLFGFGVPYIMRDSQSAVNGAWRMMMDNGGLSVGPQIVVDTSQIEPENGSWDIVPLKVWLKKNASQPKANAPFSVHNIPNNQTELSNIITLARQFIDEETNVPLIAQGEPGARSSKPAGADTMGGMAMLMNSVNVVFRRVVKNWDDDMTTPNIRRIYDWNMQFSRKNSIKGDYEVDARGSSVLLVREIQSQNLMLMAMNFTVHPVLGPWTKSRELYKKLCQSLMIPADEVVYTESEFEAEQKKQAENAPQDPNISLEVEKLNLTKEIAAIETNGRIQIAEINQETALMKMAEQHNITLDELRSRLDIQREKNASDERKLAAEAALTEQIGPSGGGTF